MLLLFAGALFSQSLDLSSKVELPGISGKRFSLQQLKENKASVIIFYSPECPICINMTKPIREMADSFAGRGVRFYIIYPGHYYTNSHLRKFQKTYSLKMGGYRDDDNTLVKYLGASVTPQAFVILPSGNVIYSGKIDNWFEDIGKRRTIITEFYLRNALDSVMQNSEPRIKKTEPVGCFIN